MVMEKNPTVEAIKNIISCSLLAFSIALVLGLIFSSQTTLSAQVHPALAFCLLWIAILWLCVVEGGQASLVGLAPVDRELYKDSHPIAYKCSLLAHTGDALDRYLLGRQFMVVFIVFTVNQSGGAIKGATLWNLPQWVLDIFLGIGLYMILLTTMVGQLNSQVNACHRMLDYLNDYVNYATICCCMVVEFSGMVHASYIIQYIVCALGKTAIESNEPPKSPLQNLFFFARCIWSIGVLGFAFAVTLTALFGGKVSKQCCHFFS
jgi:Silicon transporter